MGDIAFTVDVEHDVPTGLDTWRGVEEGLPLLLDLLSKHGIPTTFFVTGQTAERFPRIVRKISRRYEVGCHGYAHEMFNRLSAEEQFRKIKLATGILAKTTGRKILGFRAPKFRPSAPTFVALRQMGYIYDASNAHYKLGPDPKDFGLVEIRNTWPSSLLRLPPGISTRVLRLCLAALPLTVLDYHPWEFVEMTGVPFDRRFATGEEAAKRLDEVLGYLVSKGARFRFMRDIALERLRRGADNLR